MKSKIILFYLNGSNIMIQCSEDDKMIDICQRFGNLFCKKYDSFLYIHQGKRINLDLNYYKLAKFEEKKLNRMVIFTISKEENDYFEIDCWKKNEINKIKNNNILSSYFTGIKYGLNKKKTKLKNKTGYSLENPLNFNLNDNKKGSLINIKSKYIIEKQFSFLSEITKLKLIKYNKKFQNIINI